ncbi:MAG: hypothetical protein E5W81_23090, partial [Mesorhizobium sp.]
VLQDMFGGAQQPQQTQSPYGDNPLGKVLQDMFGGGQQPQSQPRQTQNPYGDNPLGKVLQDMFGGGAQQPQQPRQAPQQPQAPQPQVNPSGRPRNPFDDLFGKMFETGAQQRDDYQKGMESIFDQFKQGMGRR